ncbi:MAG: hypothetical protein KJ717_08615 [Proteobacteria bacterium]|nr:hypothetical protein [Pseudomonadota bacterium]
MLKNGPQAVRCLDDDEKLSVYLTDTHRGSPNNLPQLFDFNSHQVRVIQDEEGEPWFVAKDVCGVLGLTNSRMACAGVPAKHKGVRQIYTPGGIQAGLVISEAGL